MTTRRQNVYNCRGKVEVNVVEVNEEYLPIFDDNTWNDGIYQEFRYLTSTKFKNHFFEYKFGSD